jgi:hypothetical protein
LIFASEIHVNEIRKLELECSQLSQIKSSLDNQLLTINDEIKILSHKIQNMIKKIFPNKTPSNDLNSDDTNDFLKSSLDSIEQFDSFINKNLHLFNGEQEQTIFKLKQDLNLMIKQYDDTQIMFIKTHNNIVIKNKIPFFCSSIFNNLSLDEYK